MFSVAIRRLNINYIAMLKSKLSFRLYKFNGLNAIIQFTKEIIFLDTVV